VQICYRFAFFDEPRRHEVTESRDNSTFVPSCLCGGTDLWQIYGGAKGFNPASMLDRVCDGFPSGNTLSSSGSSHPEQGQSGRKKRATEQVYAYPLFHFPLQRWPEAAPSEALEIDG